MQFIRDIWMQEFLSQITPHSETDAGWLREYLGWLLSTAKIPAEHRDQARGEWAAAAGQDILGRLGNGPPQDDTLVVLWFLESSPTWFDDFVFDLSDPDNPQVRATRQAARVCVKWLARRGRFTAKHARHVAKHWSIIHEGNLT